MTSFLTQLIAREQQAANLVQPRPVARFEPTAETAMADSLPIVQPESVTEQTVAADPQPAADRTLPTPRVESVSPRAAAGSETAARLPDPPPLDRRQLPTLLPAESDPPRVSSPQPGAAQNTPPQTQRSQPSVNGPPLSPQALVDGSQTLAVPDIKTVERQIIERHSVIREEWGVPTEQSAVVSDAVLEKTRSQQHPAIPVQPLAQPQMAKTEPPGLPPSPPFVQPGPSPDLAPRPQPAVELPALSARPSPASPLQSPAAAPTINVTIGRIEVKAYAKSQPAPRRSAAQAPVMSLETYLEMRSGGKL